MSNGELRPEYASDRVLRVEMRGRLDYQKSLEHNLSVEIERKEEGGAFNDQADIVGEAVRIEEILAKQFNLNLREFAVGKNIIFVLTRSGNRFLLESKEYEEDLWRFGKFAGEDKGFAARISQMFRPSEK